MDFDFPAEDDPRRIEIRNWISKNPNPSNQELVDAGYVVPHWPEPWGISAKPMHQLIIAVSYTHLTLPTTPYV